MYSVILYLFIYLFIYLFKLFLCFVCVFACLFVCILMYLCVCSIIYSFVYLFIDLFVFKNVLFSYSLDSFIYLEVAKKIDKRKIKMKQMNREDALEAFEIWKNKEDKIKY